ncbi:uncharacterized protein M421DRAFT_257674 [Didymella exigua CBS 183.55]|uniref:Secreted protein n=1 Tax=Didymella exigua CBS 183.55 TaxID=1150837 RepID=A0A6A5S0J4_9PLEO|nr:uncharacterized protein M421DRAFT_257674 [Didymella exigua CBS 183.55]KAF1933110.1 hypothetical protein M421DRAFT_257674 [Didymella exigua CBS 183.55]
MPAACAALFLAASKLEWLSPSTATPRSWASATGPVDYNDTITSSCFGKRLSIHRSCDNTSQKSLCCFTFWNRWVRSDCRRLAHHSSPLRQ